MLDFSPRLVGRYTHAQESRWTVPACAIGLCVSGLRYLRSAGLERRGGGPYLALHPAGIVHEFSYGPDRENWVLMGDTAGVRLGPGATAEIADGDEWIRVPRLVPLTREQLPRWQEEYMRLRDAFRDPTPANRLRLLLGFAALLRPFLDLGRPASASPSARLKRLLDDDPQCRESIERLSRQCGYHPDHLRELFVDAYGLTPLAYRNRMRLAAAMGLIDGTGLSATEIARRVGFAHLSHFSAFFRKESGMSPREAMRKYRSG
jgi:AraC-like DNA-binding protein